MPKRYIRRSINLFYCLVSSHLSCYFCCEILVLLLETFTCLKTNKLLDCKLASIRLCYVCNVLGNAFLVLSLYILLLKQTNFLEFLVQTSLNHLLNDIIRLVCILRIILCLCNKNLKFVSLVLLRYFICRNILWIHSCNLHSDILHALVNSLTGCICISLNQYTNLSACMNIRNDMSVCADLGKTTDVQPMTFSVGFL